MLNREIPAAHCSDAALYAADEARKRSAVVFGFGPVGQALVRQLADEGVRIVGIVRSRGVFNERGDEIAPRAAWESFVTDADMTFIALPTVGVGQDALPYVQGSLTRGKRVITAEKASLASNPELLMRADGLLRYNATVGGATRMLKHIAEHQGLINEIEAVVNGTLNYLSSRMKEGASRDEAIDEARKGKYLETDTDDIRIILEDESRDVVRKAVILANRSGMFDRPITEADVTFQMPENGDLLSKRCVVRITPDGIQAGFVGNGEEEWLPKGVNNALRINGQKVTEGPGAGAEITARTMIEDSK